jgi:hypothetical protein
MSFPAKTITSKSNKKTFCLSTNFLRFNFSIFYKDTADQVGGEIILGIVVFTSFVNEFFPAGEN